MSEDWEKVATAPADDWEPVKFADRPAPVIGEALPEAFQIPEPFLHRIAMGMMIGEQGQSPAELRAKGFEDFDVAANTANHFKAGLDRIKKGFQETHSSLDVGAGALQSLLSPASAVFQALGGAGEKATGGILTGEQINAALMVSGGAPGNLSRVRNGTEQIIGGLPTAQDFSAAGKVMESPHAEANLKRMWNEDGIHPAEAVHDADADAFLKHDIKAAQIEVGTPTSFKTAKGSEYELHEDGTTTRNKAARSDIGHEGDSGIKERSAKTVYFDQQSMNAFSVPEGSRWRVIDHGDGTMSLATWNEQADRWGISPGSRNIPYSTEPAIGMHPLEIWKPEKIYGQDAYKGMHPGNAITELRGSVLSPEETELLGDGKPVSLSASATDPNEMTPLAVQPASPPGALTARARKMMEDVTGLGKNIQYVLDPMATGSDTAMVITKDAANLARRIRWDHARIDADLVKKFDDEALGRMWNAADEESVSRQLSEPAAMREHQGLATLTPEERTAVEVMHTRAQAAWLHAVDTGMVEGEGLPAYTPRMVANVAMASDSLGPKALNELGRNIFTRTSQMLHRANLEAGETEAAAQALVRSKLEKQGASEEQIRAALEQVKLVRNIRTLPLATARLEEAAVWKDMINKIEMVGKSAGSDTVSVGVRPDSSWFTIAGNPAFTKWVPSLEKVDGAWQVAKTEAGELIFKPQPIYMHPDFKGPMRAILDESVDHGKVVGSAQSLYGALMSLKGKAMTVILNSPLIHNQVVWGKVAEAAGGREYVGFGLYFRGNKIVNGSTGRAQELIERGLNPMGKRASIQDITGSMEAPEFEPGRSLTSKALAFIPGLFDKGAETAVLRAIDKAGDFTHNTLLWDRVRDVHFGLADYLSDKMVANGVDRLMADRISTHFSNIIVGSIPKEAMSAGARATANLLLFSRSFTLGNLSTFKQAALGLPKPILAQIERDFGMTMQEAMAGTPEARAQIEAISQTAKSIARRKAISTIALSVGMFYVGNALLQHAFDAMMRDQGVGDIAKGYARRFQDAMKAIKDDPTELRHMLARLSPTWDNEPWKSDRAYVGNTADGTGIYARNPSGKFGEEMSGYATKPMAMIRGKLSPMAGGLLDVLMNDNGFGRKLYNEHDSTIRGDIQSGFNAASHMVMKHLPEGQINAGLDLLRGDGNKTVNILRLTGPALGFTASVGAPGGPQRGEQLAAKEDYEARFSLAWPGIKKQIQRGDEVGARAAMKDIGIPAMAQNGLVRSAKDPAASLRGRTLMDFYQYAKPEQIRRFESKSKNPGLPPEAPQPPQ